MTFKPLSFFLILLLPCCTAAAQPPAIEWQKNYGGSALDHTKWIEPTNDGGYIICGYTRSADGDVTGNHGTAVQHDAWVLKLDKQGNLLWQRTYGGTLDDEFTYIRPTEDGGFITTGFSQSSNGDLTATNRGKTDYWTVKLDASGNIIWQQTYGGSDDEFSYAIEPTSDKGYIIAGYTVSANGDVTGNHGNKDYWIVKTDGEGKMIWQRCYGNSGSNIANSIIQTYDGGYIIAGVSDCIAGDMTMANQHQATDCWVIKTDNKGIIEWQRAYGGSSNENAKSIIQIKDSTYVVTGQTGSSDGDITGFHGGLDLWLYCIGQDGTIKWQNTMGGTGYEGSRSVRPCGDGGFIIGGSASSNNGDLPNDNRVAADYWLVKTNHTGHIEWSKAIGNTGEDNSSNALETMDNGYIIAGDAGPANGDASFTHGGDDVWAVKLSFSKSALNRDCSNIRIFPNPGSDWLRINLPVGYELAQVRLNNLSGETILINNQTGLFRVLQRGSAAAGTYFVSIINEGMKPCVTKITLQ